MNKKTTLTKIFALIVVIAMMTCVFSACNLFDKVTKITQVDVSVANGLTKAEDGSYLVGINGEISLSVDWHNFMIDKPNIRWYVATNGGERQEISGEKSKTLKYTAGASGSTYEFFVSANGVESGNKIAAKVVNGVENVRVAASSGLGEAKEDGTYEVEAGAEFAISATWTDVVAGDKDVAWYVAVNGGERTLQPSQKDRVSTWSATSIGATYVISASVNGVESANSITIVTIDGDTPVSLSFSVQISGISDKDSDGDFEAKFGDAFTLSADFGGTLVENPTFDWYVSEDGVERKLSETSGNLEFEIESRDISAYTFRAVYKGEEDLNGANTIRVEFVDSTLDSVALLTSPNAVEGKIQQNVFDTMQDVVLTAVWNETELPESVVSFEWTVDDEVQSETSKTFTFDVDEVTAACEKTVKATVKYKTQSVSTIVVLSFVEEYSLVGKVELGVTQNESVGLLSGLTSTYAVNGATTMAPGSVSVSASVTPSHTDLTAPCVWTVRDMAGTRTLAETGRNITLNLAYGKNVITATVQNVASRSIIVYALTASDLSERRYAIDSIFVWDGSVQDHYINNQEELNILVGYLVGKHETEENALDGGGNKNPYTHEMYLAPSEWIASDGVNTSSEFNRKIVVDGQNTLDPTCALGIAMNQGVDESGAPSIGTYGKRYIYLSNASILGEPVEPIFTEYTVTQENVYVRYSSIDAEDRRTKLPVDDFTETLLVETSNQLMRAVSWGYKPSFRDNAGGRALEEFYLKIKEVLREYVSDDMTELEKVAAIFDWIVNEVDYDYAAAEFVPSDADEERASYCYNAYFLEGVFNDKRAVCDGKSKAFVLLCGMEGIKAIRIIGEAGGGGHAWNKVLVDADGDGAREWFVVDSTWGDTGLNGGGAYGKKEILTYQYFLTTDAKMAATHSSDMPQPAAVTAFDVYENVTVGGATLDVTTKQQLDLLYAYSLSHGKVKIRCRISDEAKLGMPIGANVLSLGGDEENVYYFYAE